jgi:acylpyruvate hydrolase
MNIPMADPLENQLGLARARTDGSGAQVVWRRAGLPQAWAAVVDGQRFDDLPALLEAADGDPSRIDHGEELAAPDEALLSVVGRPRKILCTGQNYISHVHEGGREAPPQYPDLFPKWDNALSGPYSDITLPVESDQNDYESELAVVIGRRGRRVAAEDAEDVIFGYTAANDGSVRDYQFHATQRLAGKAWDGLTPLGPVVVPAAQLGGARPDLEIVGYFDGDVVQQDRTSNLIFGVPELIEYITTIMTLEPGDVVLTGTTAGVGFVRDPKLLLTDGTKFEVRIEGIGSLRNTYRRDLP